MNAETTRNILDFAWNQYKLGINIMLLSGYSLGFTKKKFNTEEIYFYLSFKDVFEKVTKKDII